MKIEITIDLFPGENYQACLRNTEAAIRKLRNDIAIGMNIRGSIEHTYMVAHVPDNCTVK